MILYLRLDDQNRVRLKRLDNERNGYINASLVALPFAHTDYILTQGPLLNTVDDFWQMIFEQNSHIIVMLNKVNENGQNKSVSSK